MSTPRVRFPPSPTGRLHVGNARTALFNYLFAKKYGGTLVLRIEDTDRERSKKEYEQDMFDGLAWLGIDTDEGMIKGGAHGPYRQSERTALYTKYLARLLQDNKAFYCFHAQQELEEEGRRLLHEKLPPIHACEYRDWDIAQAEKMKKTKPDHIIRFKTPAGRTIAFRDRIRGEVSFASDLIGDFSIAKKMDEPLYHFAVVVDDYEMKISHVIRGEDHIANTPKHVLLAEALGFPYPEYAHLPLLLGPDRSKLSKRHGSTALIEFRADGYLPEAMFNFLALLGWNPGHDREILSPDELIAEFSLEKIQKSGAVFDIAKLDWMNGEYIRQKPVDELIYLCRPFLIARFGNIAVRSKRLSELQSIIDLERPRLKKLSEIGERVEYFFQSPEYDKELLRWKQMTDEEIITSLNRSEILLTDIQDRMNTLRQEMERTHAFMVESEKMIAEQIFFAEIGEGDKGSILWPLRVALTGKKASPGPFEVMAILGREESSKRIHAAKTKLHSPA